jgi:ureidoglycolate lyase
MIQYWSVLCTYFEFQLKVGRKSSPPYRSGPSKYQRIFASLQLIMIEPGRLLLEPEVLRQESFSDFGTVIENPAPSLIPSNKIVDLPLNAIQANQGSALKYLDVTHMKDYYGTAPSEHSSKAIMNMFVCAPRDLLPSQNSGWKGLFPVEILERHPYTTQTFIPLGLSPLEAWQARYLVLVAPSLPPSLANTDLPVPPFMKDEPGLPGRGLPDLKGVKAFMANGSQAITYGAGTWHAPMVVIGEKPINFVVVQFANGVELEDCQEYSTRDERFQLLVSIPKAGLEKAKL